MENFEEQKKMELSDFIKIIDKDLNYENLSKFKFSGEKQGDTFTITFELKGIKYHLILKKGISILHSPIFINDNQIISETTMKDILHKNGIDL